MKSILRKHKILSQNLIYLLRKLYVALKHLQLINISIYFPGKDIWQY